MAHLRKVSQSNPGAVLPRLSEAALYTLAVALARIRPEATPEGTGTDGLADALIAELRRRNCRDMGTDPAGPARRGRLLQTVGAFGQLRTLGASSLQRQKLTGRCPLCESEAFQVFLPSVSWRCFGCERGGGLLEFAECLLRAISAPTPDTAPAPSSPAP